MLDKLRVSLLLAELRSLCAAGLVKVFLAHSKPTVDKSDRDGCEHNLVDFGMATLLYL